MSDRDTPDPIDQAYVRAEGMLDDEAARSARRARVLGAVAAQPAPAPAVDRPRTGRGGGWLMAACVAGFAAVLAFHLSPTSEIRRERSPVIPPAAETALPVADAQPPSQVVDTPAPASPPQATEFAERTQTAPPPPAPAPAAPPPVSSPPPPPPPMPASASRAAPEARAAMAPAPPPPPPMAFPASRDEAETIVTGARAQAAPSAGRSASAGLESAADASPAVLGTRLRAAAAAGRTAELTALLGQGAPVDGTDSRGETALMKSVQANHPAAAALLRRYGANLDVKNRAGASARDMAASADDPDLNRALGIAP